MLSAAFERYAQWSARVPQARGMQPSILAESFSLIEAALKPALTGAEQQVVSALLALGSVACLQEPGAVSAGIPSSHSYQDTFLELVLEGRRAEALAVVREALTGGLSLLDVYVGIVQEALNAVGRLWETNRITVGTEHMATAVAQYVLARLDAHATPRAATQGTILIAGIAQLDLEGHCLVANEPLQRMLGYDESELRRMTFAASKAGGDIVCERSEARGDGRCPSRTICDFGASHNWAASLGRVLSPRPRFWPHANDA